MAEPTVKPSTETRPNWYKGATGSWEAPEVIPGLNSIDDPKAAIQNMLRSTIGGGGATMKDQPATNWGDFLKSLTTDAASQAPLALIPEGGAGMTALRGLASLTAGTGVDQLMNKNKPLADSMMDAGVNTGVGMAVPHMLANETNYNPPTIQGTGVSAPVLKILNLLNPTSWQSAPRTVIRGTTQGPKPVASNIGIDLSNKLFTATNGKVDLSPQAILSMFGFGANAAVDSTVNRPKATPQ